MNNVVLKKRLNAMSAIYEDLAMTCGSVAELKFKIAVYGEGWTPYDWAIYLSYSMLHIIFKKTSCTVSDETLTACSAFIRDMFETIDNETDLDNVISNKTVFLELINLTYGVSSFRNCEGRSLVMSLLAHVLNKFPDLWNMNWMWKKHRTKTIYMTGRRQTHVFENEFPGRDADFYESPSFRREFVCRYFDSWKKYFSENL